MQDEEFRVCCKVDIYALRGLEGGFGGRKWDGVEFYTCLRGLGVDKVVEGMEVDMVVEGVEVEGEVDIQRVI